MIKNNLISKRILTAVAHIDAKDKVADVGCDHGYLGIACMQKGVTFIQNIDNKKAPLQVCKKNFTKYLSGDSLLKIVYTLSSGINDLEEMVDTVCILGMGGDTIIQILNENIEKARKLKKIIIESNTKNFEIRTFLSKSGFTITDEDIIEEGKKIYEIINTHYDANSKVLTYDECLFGPILLEKKDPMFLKKWTNQKRKMEKILQMVNISNDSNSSLKKIYNEYYHIKGMLEGKNNGNRRKTLSESKKNSE